MSGFGRFSLLVLASFFVLSGATASARLGGDSRRAGERIGAALEFMRSVYGDLDDLADRFEVIGRFSPGGSTGQFSVQLGVGGLQHGGAGGDRQKTDCSALFEFGDFGLLSYSAHGKCARESENAALEAEITRHPDWDDAQIAAELKRRGARFGPASQEALRERIPSASIVSGITGGPAVLEKVEFIVPRREDGQINNATVEWRVTYLVPGRKDVAIAAFLEPFDGRLTALLMSAEE